MKPIVIHGPIACGKTFNAEAFKKHYGAQRIVDEYCPEMGDRLRPGDLGLTNGPPRQDGNRWIPFDRAMKEAGLDPKAHRRSF
jgi:hypothetical protein